MAYYILFFIFLYIFMFILDIWFKIKNYLFVYFYQVEVGRTKMKRVEFNQINRFAELHNSYNNNNSSSSSSSNGDNNNNNNNNNNNSNAEEPNSSNNPIDSDDKATTVDPTSSAAPVSNSIVPPAAVQESEDNKTIATKSLDDDPKTKTTVKSITSYTGRSAVLLQRYGIAFIHSFILLL